MLKMTKIDQIHLRAVMLYMSKMSKMSKIHQIYLRAVMLCMSKTIRSYVCRSMLKMSKIIFDIFDMLLYTQYLMVWLESSHSQLSKTFFRLKIH